MLFRLLLIATTCLTACGPNSANAPKGQAQVGDLNISWNKILKSKDPRNQTPLFFTFTPSAAIGVNQQGVTEADWERQAAEWDISVHSTKKILGENAYKTASGQLATCTYNAVQRGLCGKKLGLSVQQRADLAQRALQSSPTCRWTGFDPAYNLAMSRRAGAENRTLWVKADCS